MEEKEICRSCIDCGTTMCRSLEKDYSDFCLTKNADPEMIEEVKGMYTTGEDAKIMKAAAYVEGQFYQELCRIEEIVKFAKEMGYKKIGIATCAALIYEARIAAKIFRKKGLEVYGVACKVGAIRKGTVGVSEEYPKVGKNICNPIMQAKILNKEKVDLNVVIGLCVGHDSLFYKYAEAPCTTLVTKDRVLGHNPVAALYLANTSYYARLLKEEE